MENHIPQAVTDWAIRFFQSENKYKIMQLGDYKGETAYYVSDDAMFGGQPIVLLYDGVKCKRVINPFEVLDYFH